ncbi:MAG: hypothetical protein VXY56_03365 [Pseudomonadota bacterium]|nr:hypothetical protein [Pseudomonadota bacterium]
MKMIAAFLLLLIGLGVMVLYFKPKDPLTSVDDVAVYQMKGENSAPVATRLTKQEESNKNTVSSLSRKHAAAQEEVIFYDTKSDPSIQPIDPEKDPANEIKKL